MSTEEKVDNIGKDSYKSQIEKKVETARFRYNIFRCERMFLTVLTIGLAVALITLLARRFVNVPAYTYTILISTFSIYFLVNLVIVFFRWMGESDAASMLDKKMGFKERLVTGLEYAEQNENNKFLGLLVAEINSKLDDKSIKKSIPHKFPRSTKYLVAVSILLLIFLFLPYQYPVEPDQMVTDVKESVIETTEENASVAEQEDTIKQEEETEETEETQQEQEDRILAEAKTEQLEKDQEKKAETQLSKLAKKEQQKQKAADSLQGRISDLLSSINSKLDQLEGKSKPEDKVKSQKPELTDKKKPESGQTEEKSEQAAGEEKEKSEDNKEKAADSVDTDKLAKSVDGTDVNYKEAYDSIDKQEAVDSVDVDKAKEALAE